MDCLRAPTSLDDANAVISACVGTADWRPLFLTGLGTVVVAVIIVTVLIQALRSVIR